MAKLKKPKQRVVKQLDYNEVIDYIEKKYNINTRDYAGKYKAGNFSGDAPYQDFWHWVTDYDPEINNGCYTSLPMPSNKEEMEYVDAPAWVLEILSLIEKEFGEYAEDGHLEFWVEW